MAIFLSLDKRQFGPNGLIPLRRGDDWKLVGAIIEKYSNYQKDYSLAAYNGASGFLKADASDDDGLIPMSVSIINAAAGEVQLDLAASATPDVALSEDGIGLYMVFDLPG